ncbi:TetR/AcrR family transcriptional regulator [Nocardiopsis sp. NRRL B-16309]|uniref:TetR/AcrR family transcriptional regulator n=1 Tax=Nocardiopsis sp. NRRL B-16309 TaxID=1519494 RepID=UPI0006AECACC|nr:TetR/AcrR family transcriptional regulator [Nocardiopsis sp. NRRL B-16309]KOX17151.1 TetR family transcriptional regulator [Nocardiopsis sp. NRRL B-16309]
MPDRPYHHGDLRAVLLANAERALAERGPAALSLRELAREAGVSHAAPKRHFEDKQALLDALALSGFERLTGRLEKAADTPGTIRDRVQALAAGYVGFTLDNEALIDLMYTRKHDSGSPAEMAEAVSRLLTTVMRPITEGQAAGEIIDGDPSVIAMGVAATLHGFAAIKGSAPRPYVESSLTGVVDLLLFGLVPR